MQIFCKKCNSLNKVPIKIPIISYKFKCKYCRELIDLRDYNELYFNIKRINIILLIFIVPILFYYKHKLYVYLGNSLCNSKLVANIISCVIVVVIGLFVLFILQGIAIKLFSRQSKSKARQEDGGKPLKKSSF